MLGASTLTKNKKRPKNLRKQNGTNYIDVKSKIQKREEIEIHKTDLKDKKPYELYTNKYKKLQTMARFLEKYKFPKLTQEEIKNQ